MSSPPSAPWTSPTLGSRQRRSSAPSPSGASVPFSSSSASPHRGRSGVAATGADAPDAGSDDEVDVSSPELAALEASRDEMRQSMRYSALRTAEAFQRGYYLGMSNKVPLVDATGRPLRPPRAFASAHLRPWKRDPGGRPLRGGGGDGGGGSGGGSTDGSPNGGGGSVDAADADSDADDADNGDDAGGSSPHSYGKGASSSGSSKGSIDGAAGSSPRTCVRCASDDSDTLGVCRCDRRRLDAEAAAAAPDAGAASSGAGPADGGAARSAPRDVPTAGRGGVV
eukprot:TRINITY_DN1078_c1_g1_i3.p4 TRINITY_DN1078_c1_g1~~TRINITY_DN1078_c1_g1_i3.p4  ORF type:complete len:282 (-),score=92.02 TRINITY_DN1078_c1_g1_i3:3-848(-)